MFSVWPTVIVLRFSPETGNFAQFSEPERMQPPIAGSLLLTHTHLIHLVEGYAV